MTDSALQLRVGSIATDFFLNLIAVAALVTLPMMIPFSTQPLPPSGSEPRPLPVIRTERIEAETELAGLRSEAAAAADAAARPDPALVAAATALRLELARLTDENVALAGRIDQNHVAPRAGSLGVPLAHVTDKRAVFFILAGGMILPVNDAAGRFTDMNVNGGLRIFNPKVAGDPVSSLAARTGLAARAVADINPDKQFAFVFLGDDSFTAFYQLRDALRPRGIALGWTPLLASNRQVAFATGAQGRRPDIQE